MEEPFDVASLQNPEVLGLLSQLFPNLANSSDSNPSTATSTLPNFSIDSPQGQALLPAIRTLAKFYGVSIPGVPTPDLQVESLPIQQEDLQVFAPIVPSASSLRQTANLNQSINVNSSANTNTNTDSKKGKGKASAETGAFEIVTQDESEKSAKGGGSYNPIDIPGGCSNCPRKKSATWRMRREENGTRKVMVCNRKFLYFSLKMKLALTRSSLQLVESTITNMDITERKEIEILHLLHPIDHSNKINFLLPPDFLNLPIRIISALVDHYKVNLQQVVNLIYFENLPVENINDHLLLVIIEVLSLLLVLAN